METGDPERKARHRREGTAKTQDGKHEHETPRDERQETRGERRNGEKERIGQSSRMPDEAEAEQCGP